MKKELVKLLFSDNRYSHTGGSDSFNVNQDVRNLTGERLLPGTTYQINLTAFVSFGDVIKAGSSSIIECETVPTPPKSKN